MPNRTRQPSNFIRTLPSRLEVRLFLFFFFKHCLFPDISLFLFFSVACTDTTSAKNSKTHIYNPNWPPHARYHNGQTMSLGLFVGLLTIYILFILLPSPSVASGIKQVHLTWVLVLQNLVYLSSLSGILYPGAGWTDPEFGNHKPQLYVFPCLVGLCWVGWYIERQRIERVGRQGKGKGK